MNTQKALFIFLVTSLQMHSSVPVFFIDNQTGDMVVYSPCSDNHGDFQALPCGKNNVVPDGPSFCLVDSDGNNTFFSIFPNRIIITRGNRAHTDLSQCFLDLSVAMRSWIILSRDGVTYKLHERNV